MPSDGERGDIELMHSIRMVIRYANMGYNDVMELPHDVFLQMLKNAFIEEKSKTKEGREYLKKAYRLQQTEPDYKALKKLKGYKEIIGAS